MADTQRRPSVDTICSISSSSMLDVIVFPKEDSREVGDSEPHQ